MKNLDQVEQEKEMKIIECLCLQGSCVRNKTSTAQVEGKIMGYKDFILKKSLTAAG